MPAQGALRAGRPIPTPASHPFWEVLRLAKVLATGLWLHFWRLLKQWGPSRTALQSALMRASGRAWCPSLGSLSCALRGCYQRHRKSLGVLCRLHQHRQGVKIRVEGEGGEKPIFPLTHSLFWSVLGYFLGPQNKTQTLEHMVQYYKFLYFYHVLRICYYKFNHMIFPQSSAQPMLPHRVPGWEVNCCPEQPHKPSIQPVSIGSAGQSSRELPLLGEGDTRPHISNSSSGMLALWKGPLPQSCAPTSGIQLATLPSSCPSRCLIPLPEAAIQR